MLTDKIKINDSFVQIKDNFYNTSSMNIIYQNRVTRFGIAAKTILLLFLTSLSTIFSFFLLRGFPPLLNVAISICLLFVSVFALKQGISYIEKAKVCSFIYSNVMGLNIGVFLAMVQQIYSNVVSLACIALVTTFLVFFIVSYLYYKGSLIINKDSSLVNKSKLIFFILIVAQIFSCIICTLFGIQNPMFYSVVAIPINLFFISFDVILLILHFNYVEDIITQSMPNKYEWQLSLAFVSLFINIFVLILEILIRLFGDERKSSSF
ncbi:Bax inhibitor-1/YccA family membrane protein [Candidatus Phytoplasma fraxini]|uniref:Bax inhibitor-1/YccA family protein n=1 Tax=Ash yellows phytoplasma TaxID=35780 RepID=A0ABZ2U810_ASHYP